MGKGSAPRPYSVDANTFESNWDAIFKQKPHKGQFNDREVTDTINISETTKGPLPSGSGSGEME